MKEPVISTTPYFLAIVEEHPPNWRTIYGVYFVNNTPDMIDAMIVVRPGLYKKIGEDKRLSDIPKGFVDGIGAQRFEYLSPKGFVKINAYADWDFDWSNGARVYFLTEGREEFLEFEMDKYFIAGGRIDILPVLSIPGYPCGPQTKVPGLNA